MVESAVKPVRKQMNRLKQWWAKRKLIKENRRKSEEINRIALEEELVEKLRCVMKEVQQEIAEVGFRPVKRYCHNTGDTYSTSYAVGPDNNVYRITAHSKGGYKIENILWKQTH